MCLQLHIDAKQLKTIVYFGCVSQVQPLQCVTSAGQRLTNVEPPK